MWRFNSMTARVFAYGFLALLFSAISLPAFACKPNSVSDTENSQPLYITAFAVSLDASNCPGSSVKLDEPIILQTGQFVQFWYRIQGDLDYLRSVDAREPFVFRFGRLSGNSFVPFDALVLKGVNLKKAVKEAENGDGLFDWRIWARKKVFFRPGTYSLSLYQANKLICFDTQAEEQVCSKEFRMN